MQKINLIYLIALAGILLAIPLIKNRLLLNNEFFGIAENQIRNINLDYPIEVISLHKTLGESVKVGDTLMVYSRLDLERVKQNLEFDKLELDKRNQVDTERSQNELGLLQNKLFAIKESYQTKRKELEHEESLQISLLQTASKDASIEPLLNKYRLLKQDLNLKESLETSEMNLRIKNLINEIQVIKSANQVKIDKINHEINALDQMKLHAVLLAPESGIIGQLDFNIGDKIQSYTSILKIYGTHPFIVTSYMGDRQLTTIQEGDTLSISSLSKPDYVVLGAVTSLGTRISPLPERLKKIPELRAWGREIQIKIPADNQFMQGEKVKIQILNP